MKAPKKTIILCAGILISILCTWLFARHIEWKMLIESFKDAKYIYVIPAIFISLIAYILRAMRWQSIMLPIKKISVINVFSFLSIGYMSNHILPARAGEIIRPAMIAKKEGIRITSTLTTVVLERIFDLLGVIVFGIVTLMLIPSPNEQNLISLDSLQEASFEDQTDNVRHSRNESGASFLENIKKWIGIFAAAGIGAILLLFLIVIYPKQITNVLHKIFAYFPKKICARLEHMLESFIAGLQILGNKKHVAWILFLTIIIWILTALSMYILCFSFNLDLPFTGACLVAVCLAFAVALPQAPGYIGLFHLATQKSLEVFNIEIATSQSYAIALWAISIIPITIIGILFLWREGISLKDLSKFEEQNISN